MKGTDTLLWAVARIADRIAQAAHWIDQQCTWDIVRGMGQADGVVQVEMQPAPYNLYTGTAGTALFLIEAYRHTRSAAHRSCAEGAIRTAVEGVRSATATTWSFHSGAVGVAYVAVRIGQILNADEWTAAGRSILVSMTEREVEDQGLDVIAGGAGAVPVLLLLADQLDEPRLRQSAIALGDHLMTRAHQEPVGWSWGGQRLQSGVRHLTGYAHGASGYAYAFLELYRETDCGRFRYAAEQAMAYEDQFYDPRVDNWPDFRHGELVDYHYEDRVDELVERLLSGNPLSTGGRGSMTAWCHGAPGIAVVRLRAGQILGDDTYLELARGAVERTRGSLLNPNWNYSLCHGRLGNSETLLVASEVLTPGSGYRSAAFRCALDGVERYEYTGCAWPCGTADASPDASLLLGEAGVGHGLLRLADPTTPSILFPNSAEPIAPPRQTSRREREYQACREAHIQQYFGNTLDAFEALGHALPAARCSTVRVGGEVRERFEAIIESIQDESQPERRKVLLAAFHRDRTRYDMTLEIQDFTTEYLDHLVRANSPEPSWGNPQTRYRLKPTVRLVESAASNGCPPYDEESGGRITYLLYRSANRIHTKALRPFARLLFRELEQARSTKEVTAALASDVGGHVSLEALEESVIDQVRTAYRAGVIEVFPAGHMT